jgi:hypothetical protein
MVILGGLLALTTYPRLPRLTMQGKVEE